MNTPTQGAGDRPKMILVVLFLERLVPINYNSIIKRVGGTLGIDAAAMADQKPDGSMVMPVDGDAVFGMPMNFPYPDARALQHCAHFAYWWPNALQDLSRNKAHFMVSCAWAKNTRLDAHMRQMVLVRELIEQLPVIGVMWGSCLIPTNIFKGRVRKSRQGRISVLALGPDPVLQAAERQYPDLHRRHARFRQDGDRDREQPAARQDL
jgi:hypothetical protein